MHCPNCQTAVLDAPDRCPACGVALGGPHRDDPAAARALVTVASTRENGKNGKNGNASRLAESAEHATELVVARGEEPRVPLLRRLPELPALAWRQPAVRAAVKTGASAVALSLAVSAARRTLAVRARGGDIAGSSLPSALLDAIRERGSLDERRRDRREERGLVVEEVVIYTRRIVRRG